MGTIRWMRDFITTEIVAWEYIDRTLKARHGISLAFFEVLDALADAPQHAMRIGDIARALRITVGAASKLIDRIEATQLVARQPDSHDRRASIVVLCHTGLEQVTAARTTYASEVQRILDTAFTPAEQQQFHMLTRRMYNAFAGVGVHMHAGE